MEPTWLENMPNCFRCATLQQCVSNDGGYVWYCVDQVACLQRMKMSQLLKANSDSINGITEIHYQWLVKMGYTKATPLESLALIAGEIGEAVNECRHGEPTDQFGEELADIVLRVFGLARTHSIDIAQQMRDKITKNYKSGDNRGRII